MKTTTTISKSFRPNLRLFIFFSLLSIVTLTLFSVSKINATDWKAEKKDIEQKVKKQKITINQLQEGLRLQQEKALETKGQERDLLADIKVIDEHLLEKFARLDTMEQSLTRQHELISTKEQEIKKIQLERQRSEAHLQQRFTAFYKTGTIGLLNVAFSAETLPSMLSTQDSFNTMMLYDQKILQQYRQAIEDLELTRKALTLEKTMLNTFINQVSQEKEAIEQNKKKKNELLAQIRTQTKLHEQAAKSIKKEADHVSAQIGIMKQKQEFLSQGFRVNKGKLPAPVHGKVLTLYGGRNKNKLGIESTSAGITFEAPDGTKVKAIFDGTIHYSGYLRGYGNTIIINHGFQYYSVTARIEKLLKKEGATVVSGEDIGVTGETATLTEEGLYFEIRHDNITEDPLLWLDKNKLSLPDT